MLHRGRPVIDGRMVTFEDLVRRVV